LIADVATVTPERTYSEGFGYGVQAKSKEGGTKRSVTNSDMVNRPIRPLLMSQSNDGSWRIVLKKSATETVELRG
jgi:hypothetical protein